MGVSLIKKPLFKLEAEDGLFDVYEARLDGNVTVEFKEKAIPAVLAFEKVTADYADEIPCFLEFDWKEAA